MNDSRPRPVATGLTLAACLAVSIAPALATPQTSGPGRVVGSYVATHLTGSSVVRLELSLARDGHARLRTGSSRYSQRPEGVDGREVIETGTWRLDGPRVVLHIEKSSSEAGSEKERPTYMDRTFVLTGCELHLVGSAFAFDKQHCT
ncbi:MAG: hypothetical protein NVSMB21_18080 [Vulcanimicrobiaceae bacterium]